MYIGNIRAELHFRGGGRGEYVWCGLLKTVSVDFWQFKTMAHCVFDFFHDLKIKSCT